LGISDVLSVSEAAQLALETGVAEDAVPKVCYSNVLEACGQPGQIVEDDWLNQPAATSAAL